MRLQLQIENKTRAVNRKENNQGVSEACISKIGYYRFDGGL